MTEEECILSQITDERKRPQYKWDCHLQHTEFHRAEEMATVLSEIWTATKMTKNPCSNPKHPYPSNLVLIHTGLISECRNLHSAK